MVKELVNRVIQSNSSDLTS